VVPPCFGFESLQGYHLARLFYRKNDTLSRLVLILRFLLDLNNRIYQVDLTTAIADVESIRLKHKTIWCDPELTTTELEKIKTLRHNIKRKQDRVERVIDTIGYAALGLLAFDLLVLLLTT